jgi:hypothetical protein
MQDKASGRLSKIVIYSTFNAVPSSEYMTVVGNKLSIVRISLFWSRT